MQIRQQPQYAERSETEAHKTKASSTESESAAATVNDPENAESQEAAVAYGQDENHHRAGDSPSHEAPANQVQFGSASASEDSVEGAQPASGGSVSPGKKADPLQQLETLFKEKRPVMDPAVMKLLDYVREMQDKNIQHMLDMMQQSLDRAREMMEKNEEYYYSETLPKLEALQDLVQQEQAKEKGQAAQAAQQEISKVDGAQTRSDRLVAHKLQHLTREIQQMADREVPPNYSQLQTELQQALQLALIL